MKVIAYLGNMRFELEASDEDPHAYQKIVERAWIITRLNLACSQEGWKPENCIPFAEIGADGYKYVGFVHLLTGEKIRLGQQTDGKGGHWYVRSRADKNYRGPEQYQATIEPYPDELPPHVPKALEAPGHPADVPQEFEEPAPIRKKKQRPPARNNGLDPGNPANDKQKEAIGKLTRRILGFDEYGYSDQTALLDSLGFTHLNGLTEAEAASVIPILNQRASKKK